jgi:hypothetical protein
MSCRKPRLAYDLMQHETLSVNLDADPFDVTVYLRLLDIDRQHVTLDSLRVVRLEKGVVVEVTAKFPYKTWSDFILPTRLTHVFAHCVPKYF